MNSNTNGEGVTMTAADTVIYTTGIGSVVYDNGGDPIGHVALIDCDDASPIAVSKLASSMDGYRCVFRSSPGSYHIWQLTPRPLTSVVMDALAVRLADPEHIAQSRRRESFVLRVGAKIREDSSVYKEAPELIGCYDDGESQVARGHYQIAHSRGATEVDPDRLTGGEGVQFHSYMSLTDDGKEAL